MDNPHEVLGVPLDSNEDQLRQAYLQLVRQHPPDHDPEQFRLIRTAYDCLCDPLKRAQTLLAQELGEPPDLEALVDAAERTRARLPAQFLLALGNEGSG